MRRFELFEFCDLPSDSPLGWLSDLTTAFLAAAFSLTRWYRVVAAPLAAALRRCGTTEVLDLGSGRGGPLPLIAHELSDQHGLPVSIRLSDRRPQIAAWQALAQRTQQRRAAPFALVFEPQSVDATAVPPKLPGFRTLFQSFHHLSPPQAQAVLQDAVRSHVGIAIFENTHRHAGILLTFLLVPFAVLMFTPFARPFSLRRLLLTYIVPIAPLVIFWDAVVSCLRSYTPAELDQLTRALDYPGPRYHWQQGRAWQGLQCVSWLIGTPQADVVSPHVDVVSPHVDVVSPHVDVASPQDGSAAA